MRVRSPAPSPWRYSRCFSRRSPRRARSRLRLPRRAQRPSPRRRSRADPRLCCDRRPGFGAGSWRAPSASSGTSITVLTAQSTDRVRSGARCSPPGCCRERGSRSGASRSPARSMTGPGPTPTCCGQERGRIRGTPSCSARGPRAWERAVTSASSRTSSRATSSRSRATSTMVSVASSCRSVILRRSASPAASTPTPPPNREPAPLVLRAQQAEPWAERGSAAHSPVRPRRAE